MLKRSFIRIPVCIVLSFLMLLDYAVMSPPPVFALDKKSVMVGAGVGVVAGAGIVLAAPAIAGAVGAAGGIAGIGTAIIGGIAAAGGAILGVAGAIGGALLAAGGAIVGFIGGIIASPLFIPALIVIAAVAIGYYLYRRHKKNKSSTEPTSGGVLPGADEILVTPGDYDMNPVIPPMGHQGPITLGDDDGLVIPGTEVQVSATPPSVEIPGGTSIVVSPTQPNSTNDLRDAEQRYQEAYLKYTNLATKGGSENVQEILREYQAARSNYLRLKEASKSK